MTVDFLWLLLVSASPVFELRGAIPLGIIVFKIHPFTVFLVCVLGNFLIVPLILIFLKHFSEFLMRRYYFFNRLLNYIFSKTRDHHTRRFEKWEHWALLLLVAIPSPLTGAWTGCVAAFLFGIPFKKSLWLILVGITIAGLAVTAITFLGMGAINGLQ